MPIIEYKNKKIVLDDVDLPTLNKYPWAYVPARQKEEKFYLIRTENKKTIYLHRQIMGAKKGELVDHKNRNTLDFSRLNLKITTHSDNRRNSGVRCDCASGEKNIGMRYGKFTVYKNVLGKKKYIGLFKSIEDAIHARDTYAVT